MQTLDRAQIETVIQHLNAMLNGAQVMPERRNGAPNRRGNGKADQGSAQGLKAQGAPLVQPKQPKDAPRAPAQAARPVAAEWPFETYATPKRPFDGFLWPYEIKKLSEPKRNEYYRQLHSGEIGPGAAQADQGALDDRRGNGAPGKAQAKGKAKKSAPGKTDAERARDEVLRRFVELDEKLAQAKEPLEIDFAEHSPAYVAVFLNCVNKGMPSRAAHNFAAKKAYGDNATVY